MNAVDFIKSKGITQAMLAKQMNCSRQNIFYWFSGKSSPSVNSLGRITAALNALGADTCYSEVFAAFMETKKEREKKEA